MIEQQDRESRRRLLEREIFTYSIEDIENIFSISRKPYYEQLDSDICCKLLKTIAKKQAKKQAHRITKPVRDQRSQSGPFKSRLSQTQQPSKGLAPIVQWRYLDDFELFYQGNYFDEFSDLPSKLEL